jgi:hypothetical protein
MKPYLLLGLLTTQTVGENAKQNNKYSYCLEREVLSEYYSRENIQYGPKIEQLLKLPDPPYKGFLEVKLAPTNLYNINSSEIDFPGIEKNYTSGIVIDFTIKF